jgi:transcriptional regulator with XRE-family HTH domain
MSLLLPGLAACRAAAGLSQVVLARRAGITPESVCRFERQRRLAGASSIRKLAAVLGVAPTALTAGIDLDDAVDRRADTAGQREPARARPATRMCTDCGLVKPIDGFLAIRTSKSGLYGRCRACRARRARERYQADPLERARQIERVRATGAGASSSLRNSLRRQLLAGRRERDRGTSEEPKGLPRLPPVVGWTS